MERIKADSIDMLLSNAKELMMEANKYHKVNGNKISLYEAINLVIALDADDRQREAFFEEEKAVLLKAVASGLPDNLSPDKRWITVFGADEFLPKSPEIPIPVPEEDVNQPKSNAEYYAKAGVIFSETGDLTDGVYEIDYNGERVKIHVGNAIDVLLDKDGKGIRRTYEANVVNDRGVKEFKPIGSDAKDIQENYGKRPDK